MSQQRLLLFQAGGTQFAAELPVVLGIHGTDALIAERTDGAVKSVLITGDQKTPVIDFVSVLNASSSEKAPRDVGKIMLLNAISHRIALKTDRIDRMIVVDDDQIQPLPKVFRQLCLDCFPKVLRHNSKLILMINPLGIERAELEVKTLAEPVAEKETPVPRKADELSKEEVTTWVESVFTDEDASAISDEEIFIQDEEEALPEPEIAAPDQAVVMPDQEAALAGEDIIIPDDEEAVSEPEISAPYDAVVMPADQKTVHGPAETVSPEAEIDDEIIELTEEIVLPDREKTDQPMPQPSEAAETMDEEMFEKLLTDRMQQPYVESMILGITAQLLEKYVSGKIRKIKKTVSALSNSAN